MSISACLLTMLQSKLLVSGSPAAAAAAVLDAAAGVAGARGVTGRERVVEDVVLAYGAGGRRRRPSSSAVGVGGCDSVSTYEDDDARGGGDGEGDVTDMTRGTKWSVKHMTHEHAQDDAMLSLM